MSFAPKPVDTDGEAANPGPRQRRRGPRSDEAVLKRKTRWVRIKQNQKSVKDVFLEDESITIAHVNIRGWLSNNATLHAQLDILEKRPEIVVVNESKLNRSVQRPVLAGYELVARRDNSTKHHGGGVLMFVICTLASQVTYMGEGKDAERIWAMVHTAQGPYLVGAWYRPPSPANDESISSLWEELEAHQKGSMGTVLLGDMNVHHSRWLGSSHTSAAGEAFKLLAADGGLTQLVRSPTHERGNRLDLVLTTMPDIVTVTVGPQITDHHIVYACMKLPAPKAKKVERRVYDFKKAKWEQLSDDIQAAAWDCIDSGSVDEASVDFTEDLRSMINDAIPQRTLVEHKGSHPWIDDRVLDAVQRRNEAMGTEAEAAAVIECSDVLFEARSSYQARTKKELAEMPPGSKQGWKKSREILEQKSTSATIPALRATPSSDWCLSEQFKADLLADTFSSKNELAPRVEEPMPIAGTMCEEQEWAPEIISEDDVARSLTSLREQSATGPDLIPTRVLKWCAHVLAAPVHKLLMRILDAGEWPAIWITHWVVPIYKRSAAWNPKNYRGVHVTSQVSKVMERLILRMAESHISKNVLFGANQFAFTKGRGARDAVAFLTISWISALNGRCKIGLYCSDVSGAFDKVDSELLIAKLRGMRLHPKLIRLLESWLRQRTGHVLVGGDKSKVMYLRDMVFQGTVLGPSLWNLFFADAAISIRNAEYLEIIYADDLNAYKIFPATMENEAILEANLKCQDSLHAWGRQNRVTFDPGKESSHVICQHMAAGDNCKLLGIIFDPQLTMQCAVDELVHACRWKRMTLLRARRFYEVGKMVELWKAHILSFIEYRTPGIYHAADCHLNRVDSLQRGFLHELGLSEADALFHFNLAPLCTRRDIAILGIIHRCVLGFGPPHFREYIKFADLPDRCTRRSMHAHRLQLCSIVDGRQKEIARRSLLGAIDVYNFLPASVIECCACVKSFQSALQSMVSECAATGTDGWQTLLSPRHDLHTHPLRAWWRWDVQQ